MYLEFMIFFNALNLETCISLRNFVIRCDGPGVMLLEIGFGAVSVQSTETIGTW